VLFQVLEMASWTEYRATSAWGYSSILEVRLEDPPTDEDSEASTQELHLGYAEHPSGISFRTLAATSLLLGATVASLTWAMSFGSSSWSALVKANAGESFLTVGFAEAVNGTEIPGSSTEGDIRIKVCRDLDCDKFHPHGLVHEYIANLNTCAEIPEDRDATTNGKYVIIGATAATVAQGSILTARQCGNTIDRVQHDDFSLIVGAFTDCCSFRHGGCGFRCITFTQGRAEPVTKRTTMPPPEHATAGTYWEAAEAAAQMARITDVAGPTSSLTAAPTATSSGALVTQNAMIQLATTTAVAGQTTRVAAAANTSHTAADLTNTAAAAETSSVAVTNSTTKPRYA